MKDNSAKDLVALSCIAFNQKDFSNFAKLFTLAMASSDSNAFIDSLVEGSYTGPVLAESLANTDTTLDSISNSIEEALSSMNVANRRKSMRDDVESFDDYRSQSFDEDEEIEVTASSAIKSPLRVSFKTRK
tara:strand:- start:16798 stop:17190 length:393 start_codon:yes stop_codon:yes gene_type:complete